MREVKKKEEKISDALLKVALGYQVAEVTEEYAEIDGELKLTKRKKTKKDVPPDLKAVQLLLAAENEGDYGGWSDEDLQAEKERLLAELKEMQAVECDDKNLADSDGKTQPKTQPKTVKKTTVKTKKVAGSVELNVKKSRSAPKKSTAKKVTSGAKKTVGKSTAKKGVKKSAVEQSKE